MSPIGIWRPRRSTASIGQSASYPASISHHARGQVSIGASCGNRHLRGRPRLVTRPGCRRRRRRPFCTGDTLGDRVGADTRMLGCARRAGREESPGEMVFTSAASSSSYRGIGSWRDADRAQACLYPRTGLPGTTLSEDKLSPRVSRARCSTAVWLGRAPAGGRSAGVDGYKWLTMRRS